MNINQYLNKKEKLENIIKESLAMIEELKKEVEIPGVFRKAESSDIFVGNVIWGKNQDGYYWHIIKQVYNNYDDFKAYMADDGCRYGLKYAVIPY